MGEDAEAMRYLVTGGAGFIGSAVIRHLIKDKQYSVMNVDALTYAGNLASLDIIADSELYQFAHVDICDRDALRHVFETYQPDVVVNLAAESHVDRSIDAPAVFLQTNVVGTFALLETARGYWASLPEERRAQFRLHHVSTDEVYGDLDLLAPPADESRPYAPSSPYSASKAASDHLVTAWHRTYGLPVTMSNCSNNYGPFHFPEKLIPHMILNALAGKPLPVYGDGLQVRDWLYVEDHARALCMIAERGKIGESYNVGGNCEKTNIEVVNAICDHLDELLPAVSSSGISSYRKLVTTVTDRPGHDRRYAIDCGKISRQLGWTPRETFETGLRKTVEWYLANEDWWKLILDGQYKLTRIGASP